MTNEQDVIDSPDFLLTHHFSTIGIGDVFLDPPDHPLLGQYLVKAGDADSAAASDPSFDSWEVHGVMKTTPEDFIVSEVAAADRTIPGLSTESCRLVARAREAFELTELVEQSFDSDASTSRGAKADGEQAPTKAEHDVKAEETKQFSSLRECLTEVFSPTIISNSDAHAASSTTNSVSAEDGGDTAEDKPTTMSRVDEILQQLQVLHQRKLDQLSSSSSTQNMEVEESKDLSHTAPISIPSLPNSKDADKASNSAIRDWRRQIHKYLKEEFPLLKSKTGETDGPDGSKQQIINITIDGDYDQLVPFLLFCSEDLQQFAIFRLRGANYVPPLAQATTAPQEPPQASPLPTPTPQKEGKRHRDGRMKGGGKGNSRNTAILRLRPNLDKGERRQIHSIISDICRDFHTGTDTNYPIPSVASTNPNGKTQTQATTTAITVQWSRQAVQKARKKARKNGPQNHSQQPSDANPNCLCVMKKRQTEHLTAIQAMSQAFKCRPSDIGLAGIKDMQAITYQFCTFQRKSPIRIHNNRNALHSNIQVKPLYKVPWALNNGELHGNAFEITVRNLRRIHVDSSHNETYRPCSESHLCSMHQRIVKHGFINFFGDQRVGTPGPTGFRGCDIGRLMLQGKFNEAMDCVLRGRTVSSNGSTDIPKFRQIWIHTQGDWHATLRAMPRSRGHSFPRERAILKGLQRYGKDRPLEVIRCVNYGMRMLWIHAYQSFVWNRVATQRIQRFGTAVMEGDLYYDSVRQVKVVGQDTPKSEVAFPQIILPVPGFNVQYPRNEIGDVYKEILEKDGVEFVKDKPAESTAKGGYRSLICMPTNMEVECLKSMTGAAVNDDDAAAGVDAVKLSFELQKGSYATMMLREFMVKTATRTLPTKDERESKDAA